MTELGNAVAIIGLACRFPGAGDPRQLWQNLRDGVESIRVFSAEELRAAGVDAALAALPQYVPANPALDGIEDFDAAFFGFTPREAEILDPQQRLLLECAWHALEDAGCMGAEQPRNIGVYVGAAGSSYLQTHLLSHPQLIESMGPMALLMANDKDFVAAQIAYRLNLTGPALGINTACSTSLVAIHQATAALLAYECDMALAGGASVKAQQAEGYIYQDGGVLSPDGHCRPFSDEARGTVGGSGAGLVLLKRLADALEDNDPIYAVIAGSAINNDGADKLGMTAPSVTGQARAIREALAVAGFNADSIGYVEAHGTGTPLGDPVELAALAQAHGKAALPCAIGSVKSNFGHLDSAAGVAGLAKAALALQHGRIPATLHFRKPNPKFDFSTSRFFVADRLQDWPARSGPRRAAVSSFGIGGTNAHVVLQQAPDSAPRTPPAGWQTLLLSGRDDSAVAQACERLAAQLEQEPGTVLADAALTLASGRRVFARRAAVVARDASEAAALLRSAPIAARGDKPARVAWLFAGQGSQHVGMAAALYREAPAFRAALQRCQAAFAAANRIDLGALLYPAAGNEATAAAQLAETANTQAAMFAVQYSLAEHWRALGAQPDLLLGHSLGEYVAAVVAGVFSFDDAVKLVAARGRLIASLPAGRMAMAATSADDLRARLPAGLSLCADNGPQRCVFGGAPAAVDAACAQLQAAGIACRPLPTSHAFHSSQLDPILDAFGAVVAGLALNPPRIPLVSSLSGELADAAALCDPRYWVRHLRETVQMRGALSTLQQMPGRSLCLDLSPTGTLAALARHNGVAAADILCALPREDGDAQQTCLAAAAQLWCEGVALDTTALAVREGARRLRLPGYAFQRSRHWIEPAQHTVEDFPAAESSGPLHRAQWTRIDAALPPVPREGARLLLRDRRGRAELLADADTVRVDIGAAWAELGPRHYQVAATGTGRFDTLLGSLAAQGIQVSEVIFAAGLDEIADSAALAGLQASAAELLRACKAAWPSARLAWRTLLDAACQISGGDTVSPWQRALASALSVVAQEEPNWDCRVLELGARVDAARLRELAAADFGRGHAQLGGAYWLSLRGRCLWTLRSQALAVPAAAAVPARVVVIGALGSVAAQLCRAFARAGAQVTGLGRREADTLQGDAAQRLAAMRADGVHYASADAADAAALARALRAVAGEAAKIDLVVHAASDISVERMSAFADSDAAVFARQNRPKIDASLALREAVAGLDVGAVVLMSSLSATLGGLGLGPYAGANGFQDALVEDAANAPSGWYALAWDGLGADCEDRHGALFGPTEIAELIRGVTAQLPPGSYLLARQGLARRLRGERPAVRSAVAAAGTQRSGYEAPSGRTEQTVATLYEELIGVRPVGARDNFFELGGDSLLATQLCSRLRSQCQVDLPIAAIFEAPVVADLAARVLALSASAVQEDELAALVASLDALSPEQVQELLSG
jgi:phthiocerol/phenolphthiocerol synthesis type-I polyketide synthase E